MENNNYTAGTAGRVVNIDYLTQLSRGNTKFVQEMIRIFLSENPEEIRVLESAIREKDFEVIRSSTHKLRSTLPYIGLDRVVEKEISEIEALAVRGSGIDEIGKFFVRIKETCEQACNELQAA